MHFVHISITHLNPSLSIAQRYQKALREMNNLTVKFPDTPPTRHQNITCPER